MKNRILLMISCWILSTPALTAQHSVLVEAESFASKGGWVVDQQFMDQMGSSYLMAHGMGVPVEDAISEISFPSPGEYRVFVRTYNWTSPWYEGEGPGRFNLIVNGETLPVVLGNKGKQWMWQNAGTVVLKSKDVKIGLHDLSGFNGRCDAVLFTKDKSLVLPLEGEGLLKFRKTLLGIGLPRDGGDYDLVVVGGGTAGICAAVSAARYGLKVALINNRPVLGGNNSSEVRVGLSGLIFQDPYPNLGKLVDEIGSVGHWTLWEAQRNPESERSKRILEVIENNPEKKIHNAGPASNYGDDKKLKVVESEENIKLFLNTHVFGVEKSGDKIISVTGKNIITGKETKFKGRLFADCTGDGSVGFLAGADYRVGRESRSETGEINAPENADALVMGTSVQWYADKFDEPGSFPECPWAIQFSEETCQHLLRGDWDWETGFHRDQIKDFEYIRDYALRAVYGNWSFLKNKSKDKEKYQDYKLSWVAHIGGKRESRRILGDVILKEQDIVNKIPYRDASFTTTWTIDLHYPVAIAGFDGEPFLSKAQHTRVEPYAVPYRCLYSRNIDNLFMAGRNISVTHVALGTIRVMRTTGMMGEVVGMAAAICKDHRVLPRQVYEVYLSDLQDMMAKGIGRSDIPNEQK